MTPRAKWRYAAAFCSPMELRPTGREMLSAYAAAVGVAHASEKAPSGRLAGASSVIRDNQRRDVFEEEI